VGKKRTSNNRRPSALRLFVLPLCDTIISNQFLRGAYHEPQEKKPMTAAAVPQEKKVTHVPPIDPETDRTLHQELLERRYMAWLDKPIPALGQQTLRQAVRTPEGRAQAIEILKQLEYNDTRRGRRGKVVFDVNTLRDELGLPRV
jgi:hypothetical protein